MEFDLSRFHTAQASSFDGYETALREIRRGKKTSHWMWYIFPQLKGLGRSSTAEFYGIDGLEEAKAYAADPQHDVYARVLERFYKGRRDDATLEKL